jgi:hypothetical protein
LIQPFQAPVGGAVIDTGERDYLIKVIVMMIMLSGDAQQRRLSNGSATTVRDEISPGHLYCSKLFDSAADSLQPSFDVLGERYCPSTVRVR